MFGPQLEPPPDPPAITTFEQQYGPAASRPGNQPGAQPDSQPGGAPDDRLSVSLSLTLASDYYFRGIAQRNDRASLQPGLEAAYLVHDGDRVDASVFAGLWADLRVHDLADGGSIGDRFYELDLYAGIELACGRFAGRAAFTEYLSPTGDFSRIHEFSLALALDDSGLYGERFEHLTINPAVLVAFEVGPDGADGGSSAGVFLSLGIEPTWEVGATHIGDVSVSAPVEVGISLSDYYETPAGDKTLGYVSVGARLALDPGGAWPVITLGADYIDLADGGKALAGRGSEVTLSMDLAWSF